MIAPRKRSAQTTLLQPYYAGPQLTLALSDVILQIFMFKLAQIDNISPFNTISQKIMPFRVSVPRTNKIIACQRTSYCHGSFIVIIKLSKSNLWFNAEMHISRLRLQVWLSPTTFTNTDYEPVAAPTRSLYFFPSSVNWIMFFGLADKRKTDKTAVKQTKKLSTSQEGC